MKSLKDLDLKFDCLFFGRALGMFWNVESETLGFKITSVDKQLTCTGILATVSSIYDPFGVSLVPYYYLVDVFFSKFVVRGKIGMNLSHEIRGLRKAETRPSSC